MIKHMSFACLLVLLVALPARADLPPGFDWDDDNVQHLAADHPEQLDAATPDERARIVALLLEGSSADHEHALTVLQRASDLDRFQTLRVLDRSDGTTVRKIYDSVSDNGKTELLQLTQASGAAGTRAGLQQVGIISDNDDTAFPTDYTPDGPMHYKGASDFFRLVGFGTDGKGDPANIHYVSARIPALFPDSRMRLEAAGMPSGTFDGDNSIKRFAFGGLDGIEQSKIENIDLWMKLHPGQRFVLLGDTLQRDPEVYRWVLEHHRDQVELVLIHRAGGPDRNPADYKGEVFFDDYVQAQKIVNDLGIPQPGAKLPDQPVDFDALPLPNTDMSSFKKAGFFKKVLNTIEENAGAAGKDLGSAIAGGFHSAEHAISGLFHHGDKKPATAGADDANREAPSIGARGALQRAMGER